MKLKALLARWRKQYNAFMDEPMSAPGPEPPTKAGLFCAKCDKHIKRSDRYKIKAVEHVDCANPKLERKDECPEI
jgi:hypothetical protein